MIPLNLIRIDFWLAGWLGLMDGTGLMDGIDGIAGWDRWLGIGRDMS